MFKSVLKIICFMKCRVYRLTALICFSVLLNACGGGGLGGVSEVNFDRDGDGVPNIYDLCPDSPGWKTDPNADPNPDRDGDGCRNEEDALPDNGRENKDTDGDGVGDNADDFPMDPTEQVDTDEDGVGDGVDKCRTGAKKWRSNGYTDRDGDGCRDYDKNVYQEVIEDVFPDDPSENKDSDGDGVGDRKADKCLGTNIDPDGDGTNTDPADENGCNAEDRAIRDKDSDGDGKLDKEDCDDDGDGYNDGHDDNDVDPACTDKLDVDSDGDGLIEIYNAEMLNNIRYDLRGTSYKTSETDAGDTTGCGGLNSISTCNGYELVADIELAPVEHGKGGWQPVGSGTEVFLGVFEGNNFTISNLIIFSSATDVGFFAVVGTAGVGTPGEVRSEVRNLRFKGGYVIGSGVVAVAILVLPSPINVGVLAGKVSGGIIDNVSVARVQSSSATGRDSVGGLVGRNETGGVIKNSRVSCPDNCSAIRPLVFSSSGNDHIGGLVGYNEGKVQNSNVDCFSCAINSGDDDDNLGGLVGYNSVTGIIRDSESYCYACISYSKLIDEKGNSNIGGLVGYNNGTIQSSSAGGRINGVDGSDNMGGLVGLNGDGGKIENSYSRSSYVYGGDRDKDGDRAGGLVGVNTGRILDSYSTNGVKSSGGNDVVGGLVGQNWLGAGDGIIKHSYSTGDVDGGKLNSKIDPFSGDEVCTGSFVEPQIVGRLVGSNSNPFDFVGLEGTVIASYYSNQAAISGFGECGKKGSSAGTGITIGQLKAINVASTKAHFGNDKKWSEANWDFGSNAQYPSLMSLKTGKVICGQPGTFQLRPTRKVC